MAADLGNIHVMIALWAYRMQELWSQREFHDNFKGKPERPVSVWQGKNPFKQPLTWWCVKL
jgi:hypothetical protein